MGNFNQNQGQQFLRSPSIPLRTLSTKQYNPRAPSSLKRSSDLLSMEQELHELLKNSNLNSKQKKAFEEMLESTFDLFQTPLTSKSQTPNALNGASTRRSESLIDSSSVALYGKMQSLVAALTSLILNEEEATRVEEFDETHVDNLQPKSSETSPDKDSSTEFSEEEDGYSQNNSALLRRAQSNYDSRYNSPNPSNSQIYSPTGHIYSNGPAVSRSLSRSSSRQEPAQFTKRSPSFRSSNLAAFPESASFEHSSNNTRNRKTYDLPNGHETKPNFQVMSTAVPRSFSHHTSNSNQRPKSMYINSSFTSQQFQQRPVYSSPQVNSRRHSLLYDRSFDEDEEYDGRYRSRADSNASVTSSSRKRYSMRF